jgi:hypothetical protein
MLLKLANNWTAYFLRMPAPSTVDEAAERLIVILSDSDTRTLANTPGTGPHGFPFFTGTRYPEWL